MALHQFWIDVWETELKKQVVHELNNYHRVRQVWGLGPLKLKQRQGVLTIWAKYFDIECHRTRQAFLGGGKGQSGWRQALQRVKHVKSFL